MRLAKVLNGIGRSLITAGVLILLFVAYQLWGTGIREAQAQDRLSKKLDQQLATTTTTTPGTAPVQIAPPIERPPEGDPIGRIEIPKIGLNAVMVEGVDVDDLKEGPGHYVETPLPGQKGNVGIAGHRTTYGAPFASIDELKPGDEIFLTTVQGRFRYVIPNTSDYQQIVSPSHVEVLDDKGDNRVTLTACHPKYSASQRIIVYALLEGNPLPATPAAAPQQAGLGGKQVPKLPAIVYALLCAAIWVAAWFVGKHWRKWPAYAIGLPFFLVALFYFFENFSRLLPSNY